MEGHHKVRHEDITTKLTDDMAQHRKYWMIKIMAGPAERDCQER